MGRSKIHNYFYLGASKFALARVDFSNITHPKLVFFQKKATDGFQHGCLSDLESASREARSLFEAAKLDDFPEISLILSCPQLKGYTFSSSIFYSDSHHVVGQDDLDEVIRQTRNVSMVPLKETIIQSIPQEYWVNDSRGIQNPLDLEAERLGVALRLITIGSEYYRNLAKIFDRSEAEIKTVIPKAWASSFAVLEELEKKDGVLLIDMGGYATDLIYFNNGVLLESKTLGWGTDALTQNLIDRFHLTVDEARRLKEEFGTLLPSPADEESLPLNKSQYGIDSMKRGDLREFINQNLESFWGHLDQEVKALQEDGGRISQLVISGGGSKLEGLLEKIEERYSIRTSFGNPKPFAIEFDGPLDWDVRFSALWGAIRRDQQSLKTTKSQKAAQNLLVRAAGQAREWLESYF